MADLDTVLQEIKDFRHENSAQLGEEILKVSARLDQVEGRIENTEVAMIEKIKLQVKVEDKLTDLQSLYAVPATAERALQQ